MPRNPRTALDDVMDMVSDMAQDIPYYEQKYEHERNEFFEQNRLNNVVAEDVPYKNRTYLSDEDYLYTRSKLVMLYHFVAMTIAGDSKYSFRRNKSPIIKFPYTYITMVAKKSEKGHLFTKLTTTILSILNKYKNRKKRKRFLKYLKYLQKKNSNQKQRV